MSNPVALDKSPTNQDKKIIASCDLPGIKEPWSQYHDSFTSALFKLHLDGAEFPMDDAYHPLYFLWRNGACPTLLSKKVHHVCGKFITSLRRKGQLQGQSYRDSYRFWQSHIISWSQQEENVLKFSMYPALRQLVVFIYYQLTTLSISIYYYY